MVSSGRGTQGLGTVHRAGISQNQANPTGGLFGAKLDTGIHTGELTVFRHPSGKLNPVAEEADFQERH